MIRLVPFVMMFLTRRLSAVVMKVTVYLVHMLLPGLIAILPVVSPSAEPADDLERRLEKLRSLPYTATTTEEVNPGASGVMVHNADLAWNGYNLYCCALCPDVVLMDMDGDLVHRWVRPDSAEGQFQHAIMLPDGGVVVICFDPRSLIRLDRSSNLQWRKDSHCHHDVMLTPDSTLYVLVDERLPYRDLQVTFPLIVELTLDGEEIGRWSARKHLEDMKRVFDTSSFLDTILDDMLADGRDSQAAKRIGIRQEARPLPEGEVLYDYFHMNTVNILPETQLGAVGRTFRPGNVLTCFRHVNQIAILDQGTGEPLWAWGEGVMQWPHHPTMLDNGNILVFDNGSHRRYSRVIELNPRTLTVEWEYMGDPREDFFSYSRGSAQRLPNGNTLICESDKGKAFEVTEKGETVWEWLNPVINDGRRAQVYRMMRLSPETVDPLLKTERHR